MNNRKHDETLTGEEIPEQPSHGLTIPDEAAQEADSAIGSIVYEDINEDEGE